MQLGISSGAGQDVQAEKIRHKGHKLTVTCACLNSTDEFIYTGSKDGSIIKWKLAGPKILAKVNSLSKSSPSGDGVNKHHTRHINCIAISSDDKFLATGGYDKLILIWSPESLTWLHTFKMHRQEVTSLAFRLDHHTLYSGSKDRSVMLWTLEDDDNRCFVEALYGHEHTITSLDSLRKERIISSGGMDRSIRVWKIVEEAQTVYESKHDSVEIVKFIDDKTFISGGSDGSLTVWTTMKRSPLCSVELAHRDNTKFLERHKNTDPTRYDQRNFTFWISALATFNSSWLQSESNKIKKRKASMKSDEPTGSDDDQSNDDGDDVDGDSKRTDGDKVNSNQTTLVASGSCNSEIKLWELSRCEGKYELKLIKTLDCDGFINDLRFTSDGKRLIVACGQEHKFGRWWKLKKAKNCIRIFELNE